MAEEFRKKYRCSSRSYGNYPFDGDPVGRPHVILQGKDNGAG